MPTYISGLYYEVTGHDSILVICDRILKILHFIVTIEKIMTKGLVKLFKDNV